MQYFSRQDISLTDEHISMLEKCMPKFRAADTKLREKIVQQAADRIKRTWKEGMEFDRDTVLSVCKLSAQLN